MIFRASISRVAHFNSAHRLHVPSWSEEKNQKVFGVCNNPSFHGHNYELHVKVTGEIDDTTGYVMDTKILKDIIEEEVIHKFDHKNLNLDTAEFASLNPTAENIAMVIWKLLRTRVEAKHDLSIKLFETPRNYVEFNG